MWRSADTGEGEGEFGLFYVFHANFYHEVLGFYALVYRSIVLANAAVSSHSDFLASSCNCSVHNKWLTS